MTLLEKFYEWWDNADFEDIIMMALIAGVTVLFVGVAMGGAQ